MSCCHVHVTLHAEKACLSVELTNHPRPCTIWFLTQGCGLQGLYCVGDSTFPGQGVNAVVFSGFGCAHRVMCDLGMQPTIPLLDGAFNRAFSAVRNRA